jgi:hypothetical protein
MKMMKTFSSLSIAMIALFTASSLVSGADAKKVKPYPLNTCVVSDEKIGTDPSMKPYVFTQDGREVKLCCKSCLKDFKKDTAKYMAKIEAAEKKAK